MSDAHASAQRTLAHALTLGDAEGWDAMTLVLAGRLRPDERVGLAWAALRSLDRDHLQPVVQAVMAPSGPPMAPLMGLVDEAESWAACASPEEVKAYAVAAVARMPPEDRQAFSRYLAGVSI